MSSDCLIENIQAVSIPDIQSGSNVPGAPVSIAHAGIQDFRMPLVWMGKPVDAHISATVQLDGKERGVHMSRFIRILSDYSSFSWDTLETVLGRYKEELSTTSATLRIVFDYPILQPSLRSGLSAHQYYRAEVIASIDPVGRITNRMYLDVEYSSACPCSAALAEHSREHAGKAAIPHSQRSRARVCTTFKKHTAPTIESIQALALNALKTEAQVLVKREDEQAFAELNGQYTKFVEDAARLLYKELDEADYLEDFQIACIHYESLHAHNAIAVLHKGVPGGFPGTLESFGNLLGI